MRWATSTEGFTYDRSTQHPRLTWKVFGIAFPVYLAAYVVIIGGVFTLFGPARSATAVPTLIDLVAILPVTVVLLNPWLLRMCGLTRKDERREQTWSRPEDLQYLGGKQAGRQLMLFLPVFMPALLIAAILVVVVARLG